MKRFFVLLIAVMALFGLSTAGVMAQKKTPEARFAKLDKNGDKKLSLEEFLGKRTTDQSAKREKSFKALDKDHDGFLTLDEFKSSAKAKKRKDK
jgi:Ca2+-binding EF-hand superfamily protein